MESFEFILFEKYKYCTVKKTLKGTVLPDETGVECDISR
jgi:uncharacterized OsmC-like protein